jgi:hypothetical protein
MVSFSRCDKVLVTFAERDARLEIDQVMLPREGSGRLGRTREVFQTAIAVVKTWVTPFSRRMRPPEVWLALSHKP